MNTTVWADWFIRSILFLLLWLSFFNAWRRIKMGVKVLYPQERLVLWYCENFGDSMKVEDLAVAFTAEEELGKKAKGMKFGLLLSSVGLIISILVLLSLILK